MACWTLEVYIETNHCNFLIRDSFLAPAPRIDGGGALHYVNSAVRAGTFKASASTDPMWLLKIPEANPPRYRSEWFRPRGAPSVSPGRFIITHRVVRSQWLSGIRHLSTILTPRLTSTAAGVGHLPKCRFRGHYLARTPHRTATTRCVMPWVSASGSSLPPLLLPLLAEAIAALAPSESGGFAGRLGKQIARPGWQPDPPDCQLTAKRLRLPSIHHLATRDWCGGLGQKAHSTHQSIVELYCCLGPLKLP